MAHETREFVALESKADEQQLDAQRGHLQSPGVELIAADNIEAGLQWANALWFLVYGPEVFGPSIGRRVVGEGK